MSSKPEIPLYLKKPYSKRNFIQYLALFFSIFGRWFHKTPSKMEEIGFSPSKVVKTEIQLKIVRFFRLLIILKRFLKFLKFRTKFRGIENITQREIGIFNDASYIQKTENFVNFSFLKIKSKFLRKIVNSLRKFTKKNLKDPCRPFLSFFSKINQKKNLFIILNF